MRRSPGGQGRGVVLGWLQSVRACAWLARARLQPSSQEPPASTQRVQTDDCHWLRFEARGILLTEKSDTPGGRGEKGAAAQTRGREKGRGERLYPALLISIKIRGGAKAFAPKATCFSSLQSGGCKAGKPGACSSRPFRPPGLHRLHSRASCGSSRAIPHPTRGPRRGSTLGKKKIFRRAPGLLVEVAGLEREVVGGTVQRLLTQPPLRRRECAVAREANVQPGSEGRGAGRPGKWVVARG